MTKILFCFILLALLSCGLESIKFAIGDEVKTQSRCMATSNEFMYNDMQEASDRKDEKALQEMMIKGDLLILNNGQPGVVTWADKEKSQIKISGGTKWWVANRFLIMR